MKMHALVSICAGAAMCAGSAGAAVLDFEGLAGNSIYDGSPISLGGGLEVTLSTTAGTGQIGIFDTDVPSAVDPDLVGPITPVGGGPAGDFGNVAIIQGSNFPPVNDFAGGGDIVFSFNRLVRLNSLDIIDAEEGATVMIGGLMSSELIGADNMFVSFSNDLDVGLVDSFVVSFDGSGAVDNVSVAPVPVPATLPLIAVALGGLGLLGRRRRG